MLEHLLQREVVIALAVAGAILATLGYWMQQKSLAPPLGRMLYLGGYGISGASVLLFILAGLLGYPR